MTETTKVALVTGASRGLGAATALLLARNGYAVCINYNHNVDQAINDIHNVEMEDEEVVLNVQKGVESQFYEKGRYSAEYEKGTHHFHRLICKYINQSL